MTTDEQKKAFLTRVRGLNLCRQIRVLQFFSIRSITELVLDHVSFLPPLPPPPQTRCGELDIRITKLGQNHCKMNRKICGHLKSV